MDAALRSKLIHTVYRNVPRVVWNAMMWTAGKPAAMKRPFVQFGTMKTCADASPLVSGRFADMCERAQRLDPGVLHHQTRYRLYTAARLARMCRSVPGDYVFAGVSYGVAPRLIYEYTELHGSGKTMHLIDPFEGTGPGRTGAAHEGYNRDPELVRSQYPNDAPVEIHRAYIPQALPVADHYAFIYSNTGDATADCASLPHWFERLAPGGVYITDQYAHNMARYDAAFTAIGVEPIWLPSGQCFVIKACS